MAEPAGFGPALEADAYQRQNARLAISFLGR
jgi:hypothetical protein